MTEVGSYSIYPRCETGFGYVILAASVGAQERLLRQILCQIVILDESVDILAQTGFIPAHECAKGPGNAPTAIDHQFLVRQVHVSPKPSAVREESVASTDNYKRISDGWVQFFSIKIGEISDTNLIFLDASNAFDAFDVFRRS